MFSEKTEFDLIAEAEQRVSEIQEYKDTINLIISDGLDTLKHPEHLQFQVTLNNYTKIILPEFTKFVNLIASIRNMTSLGEAESLFSTLEISINKSLGPFFLKGDSTRGWTIPAENETVENMCSWYIESFDKSDTLFDKHLRRYRSLLPPEQETLSKNFNEVVRLLLALSSLCKEKLKEPIGLLRSYLDEEITKKNLSEVIANPDHEHEDHTTRHGKGNSQLSGRLQVIYF